MNLVESIHAECDRVRELIKIYETLPSDVGAFGIAVLRQDISNAEWAISNGNTVAMLKAYKTLKEDE